MYRCAVAGGLLLLTEMKWKWFSLALFPTGTEFFLSEETIALCPAAETALLSQYKTSGLLLKHCLCFLQNTSVQAGLNQRTRLFPLKSEFSATK